VSPGRNRCHVGYSVQPPRETGQVTRWRLTDPPSSSQFRKEIDRIKFVKEIVPGTGSI
jgi:hypothetical protein